MPKNFDIWNNLKKKIDAKNKNRFYHPREIWWCSLGVNVGYEQDGKGNEYERPVLILRSFSKNVCLIVPLTTSEKENMYHIPLGKINGKISSAIISQIRLIDTKRLVNRIAILDKKTFGVIQKSIRNFF